MQFTQSQQDAINHTSGNLQLIACAGSGKTEVVARRVANLLKPGPTGGGCTPANIVAFTFTEKAAAELKERVVERCREEIGEIPGMAEMYIGTIHGFCLELLKAEVPRFLRYGVLNEVQQAILVDRNSAKSGLTTSMDLKGDALRRYVDTNNYVAALGILREADLVHKYLAGNSIVAGLAAYKDLLEKHSYLDDSSILTEASQALAADAGLRSRLKQRLRHVIVDEYQDVNSVQERIVRHLSYRARGPTPSLPRPRPAPSPVVTLPRSDAAPRRQPQPHGARVGHPRVRPDRRRPRRSPRRAPGDTRRVDTWHVISFAHAGAKAGGSLAPPPRRLLPPRAAGACSHRGEVPPPS